MIMHSANYCDSYKLMSQQNQITGAASNATAAHSAGDAKQSRRPVHDQSTSQFISHSVSPTNQNNRPGHQLQQYYVKKTVNIKKSNLNAKGSFQQPQILRNIKRQQAEFQSQQIAQNNPQQIMNMPTVDQLYSLKSKQYQKSKLKGAMLSKDAFHQIASRTTTHPILEAITKLKSPTGPGASIDDLENYNQQHQHFQTMYDSRKQELTSLMFERQGKNAPQLKHHQQQSKMNAAEQGPFHPLLNTTITAPAAKQWNEADTAALDHHDRSQQDCDNEMAADNSSSQRLSAQQLQYRLQCCSSRTTSNDTPYRNGGQIERIFRSSKNGSSQRNNKDLTASIQNRRSDSPPEGPFGLMPNQSMRQAASRQLKKQYQHSSDSSLDQDNKAHRGLPQDGYLRMQRQPSSISDDRRACNNNRLIQSQDISKQIIRKSVIASTQKLILNPKQIVYAAGTSGSASSIPQESSNEQSAEGMNFARSHPLKMKPTKNSDGRKISDVVTQVPQRVAKRKVKSPEDQRKEKMDCGGNDFDDAGLGCGFREPYLDGAPVIQEWEEFESSQIGIDKQALTTANEASSVQKVRFRMSKLNQSKKFSTPVDHISPQESGPASSADMSPTKLPQQDDGDERMLPTGGEYKQKQYLVTEVEVGKPTLEVPFGNRNGLEIKQIQSDQQYQQKYGKEDGSAQAAHLPGYNRTGNGTIPADRGKLLNFNSPSSIKIIDLKQPNVRKLLMDSLQELVKERKHKMHQRESWQFNEKYDAIIKNTIQNRRVNIEKAIPPPKADVQDGDHNAIDYQAEEHSIGGIIAGGATLESGSGGIAGQPMNAQFFDEASVQLSNFNETLPEHSIISRSDLSAQLKIQAEKGQGENAGNTVTKKQSLSQLDMNFQNGVNFNVAHGDKQGLITPRQQQRLITKLNEIYEAQLLNDAQERTPSADRSPERDLPPIDPNRDVMAFEGALTEPGVPRELTPLSRSRPREHLKHHSESVRPISEEQSPFMGNIISVINNDKLYYIANDATTSQSQMSRFLQIHQQFSQKSLNDDVDIAVAENELLVATQNTQPSRESNRGDLLGEDQIHDTNDQLAVQTFSRNNNKFDSQQVMVQQVSTDKKHIIQQADLISLKNYQKYIKKEPNQLRERFVTKVPSVSDLTFFDLANPMHLNQLFTRLEDIQQQEIAGQDQREMPKALQNQSKIDQQMINGQSSQVQQSGYNSPHIQQEQSGEESGNVSSHQTHTPIHSRQGVEQAHSIDVDLLIQKLLKVPNVDVLDSIFSIDSNVSQRLNINLQPSNGTGNSGETYTNGMPIDTANQISTKEMIQRVTGNIEDILNFKPQVGESSLSSGGHGSEIQSSGMMTPKSQKSLSTPNQIKLLQERNFNIQGFRFPIQSQNLRVGQDCQSNQQLRDINFYPSVPADDQNQSQSGGIVDDSHSMQEAEIIKQGKHVMDGEQIQQCHDLMSPMTKKLLMQKLKEVQEQIGDSQSNDSLSDNELTNPNNPGGQLSRNIVDGVVAGSKPDPQIFGNEQIDERKRNKHLKSFYDPATGALVQRALDNTRHHKTKLIISQIDEEDENLQFDEDEEMIQQQKENRDLNDKIKLNTQFEPSPRNINQEYPANQIDQDQDYAYQIQGIGPQRIADRVAQATIQQQPFNQNANNMPQIDLLIQKLKQLEMQQRLKASEHQYSSGSQEQNLNMQRQSLSHGTSHNQSRTNMHDPNQFRSAVDAGQSNSCEKVTFQLDSKQSSLGHSSCSSPLKVGNINIYNMPKTHEQNTGLRMNLRDDGKQHKVSQQSITQQQYLKSNWSPDHHPPQSSSSQDPLLPYEQFQNNNGYESSQLASLQPGLARMNGEQVSDGMNLRNQGAGLAVPAEWQPRQQQPSAFMSRNHSVANILEQVIKRLEGLKSKE